MMKNPAILPVAQQSGEIDLFAMTRLFLARWRVLAGCIAGAFLTALVYLHLATYTYTVEMKVTPAQSTGNDASSLLASSGIGSLASITGISMPRSQSSAQFVLYLVSVDSRSVANTLAKRTDLMKVVFRNEWDEKSRTFVPGPAWRKAITDSVKSLLGVPTYPWTPPDGARLQIYLEQNIEVLEDQKKNLATLTYEHEDPIFATAFMYALHKTINDELSRAMLASVDENIKYLSRRLPTITITEHRQAIADALSEQEKLKMMASSGAPFAAKIIGVPSASFRPTSPRTFTVIATALFLGLCLGMLGVLGTERLKLRL